VQPGEASKEREPEADQEPLVEVEEALGRATLIKATIRSSKKSKQRLVKDKALLWL